MSTEAMLEAHLISHTDSHWDIVSARYESKKLYIHFQDGTSSTLSTSQFPALADASDDDFKDLQVSPCGLILENDLIEWDCAEAGLYKLINQM